MKISFPKTSRVARRTAIGGFTLPEVMIAMTVFVLMVGGIIFANLFGLRMYQLTATKIDEERWSRETSERLLDEIHTCHSTQVGYVSNGVFVALMDGEQQQGTGLLINPTADTNTYVIYFLNSADQTLRRTTEQPNSTVILAGSITNAFPFSAQDLAGNVLTNQANNRLIHLALEFYQPQRFLQRADYYKLETSVKQRVVP